MVKNLFSAQDIERLEIADRFEAFTNNFGEFAYGIKIMESIYNVANDGKIPEKITRRKYQTIRRIISMGSIAIAGAKGTIERLSIFHPEQMYYGYALVGLRVGSALLHGIDRYLKKSADNHLYQFLKDANPDSTLPVPDFPALTIHGEAMTQLSELTWRVRGIIGEEVLQTAEQNMLDRFDELLEDLFGYNVIKKVGMMSGQGLAFTLGSAAGISIATTGQDSLSSYRLTLMSALVDPVVEKLFDALSGKDITRKYLQACEILYLCEYFLQDRAISA